MKEIGHKKHPVKHNSYKPLKERISNYEEFFEELSEEDRKKQAKRCLDCSIEFCVLDKGCPMKRPISDFTDLLSQGEFKRAYDLLEENGGFTEITGRVCPAPCERACTLNIGGAPVTICENELFLSNMAIKEGWLQPRVISPPKNKRVSVVGSGPTGLMATSELNKKGYEVHVYEKKDTLGGLLAYGIPTMKLSRSILQKRLDLLQAEGVHFHTNTEVGKDISMSEILKKSHGVLLAHGATKPKVLGIPKEKSLDLLQAIDYLEETQRSITKGTPLSPKMNMKGKTILIVGGGDTAEDCIATSMRQKAKEVFVLIRTPREVKKKKEEVWPRGLMKEKEAYGFQDLKECHGLKNFLYATISSIEKKGGTYEVSIQEKDWKDIKQNDTKQNKVGLRRYTFNAVILAIGFEKKETPLKNLWLHRKVFVAGDARTGSSLVVNAFSEGIEVAKKIDNFLTTR